MYMKFVKLDVFVHLLLANALTEVRVRLASTSSVAVLARNHPQTADLQVEGHTVLSGLLVQFMGVMLLVLLPLFTYLVGIMSMTHGSIMISLHMNRYCIKLHGHSALVFVVRHGSLAVMVNF